MHRIVIVGTGTVAANRRRRFFEAEQASITRIDQDDRHVYQSGGSSFLSGSRIPRTSCDPGNVSCTWASRLSTRQSIAWT